jgi:hypothetical protein
VRRGLVLSKARKLRVEAGIDLKQWTPARYS